MLSEQMQQLINYLIQVELNSAYFYLAHANYMERLNLKGMAHWLFLQYQEELDHAHKLMEYVNDLGGTVEARAIPSQPINFGTPLEAWQQVLGHERQVTLGYQQAYDTALRAQDFRTAAFLADFLKEQIDEEAHALVIVGRLQIAQDNTAALLLLDRELEERKG